MRLNLNKTLSRPDRIFRLAGILSVVITSVNTISSHLYGSRNWDGYGLSDAMQAAFGLQVPRPALVLFDLVAFTVFGAAFWRNMDADQLARPGRRGIQLLALQSLIGLTISPALFFLVSAEIGFVLQGRPAILWVASLILLGVSLVFMLPEDAALAVQSTPGGLPHAIAILLQCLMYPMILLFSYCLGLVGATEWRHRQELAHVNAELKATQQMQAENARLAERLHISRELHDVVGHHLAALSVNLQLASRLAEGEAGQPIREAHLIARTLLADVREVVGALRNEPAINLRQALETLASGIQLPAIHINMPEELSETDPLQAQTLFRCVQELITNAVRHAGARNLWLTFSQDEAGISLQARDDGRGAEQLQPGNGLRGMHERITESGGEMRLEYGRGHGFAARIFLPSAGGIQ